MSIAKQRLKKAFNHNRMQEIKFKDQQLLKNISSFMDKHRSQQRQVQKAKNENGNKNKGRDIVEYVDIRLKGIHEMI